MTVLIAGGDSFTYGSELSSQEHTWANLLANLKGWNICNTAQPGYSNSAIRRNVMNAVNEYKDLKDELDGILNDINSEYEVIKKEFNSLF